MTFTPNEHSFRDGPYSGSILPEYSGLGISNVVPTIARHFGLDTPIKPLRSSALPPELLNGAERIVTLVIDALGYQQLTSAMQRGGAPNLSRYCSEGGARLSTLTSTFPSTTVTALTTLGTGLPPGQHGVVTQVMYDANLGCMVDILRFTPTVAGRGLDTSGISPESWIGLPTVYDRLAGKGVRSTVVNHAEFDSTALSLINHRGARYVGFASLSDLCANLRQTIESAEGPAYIHAYWAKLDDVSHRYGVSAPQQDAEIRLLDYAIGELLLKGLRAPRTLLLLFADHGHIDTSAEHTVWLNEHPELLGMLQAPPAGVDRAGVLYVRPDCVESARKYIATNFGHCSRLLTAEESIDLGMYGPQPVSQTAQQRLGQLLLLPVDNWVFLYRTPGSMRKFSAIGKHGGLSPEEMLVPLIAHRLD